METYLLKIRIEQLNNGNSKQLLNKKHLVIDMECEGEDGEITVTKAQKRNTGNGSRSNPEYEYSVKGAYIDVGADSNEYRDNRDATVLHGVNINKVKSVSGDTYNLQTFLKQNGFKWNRDKKRWER